MNFQAALDAAAKQRGQQLKVIPPETQQEVVNLPAKRKPILNMDRDMASIYTPIIRGLTDHKGVLLFVGAHAGVGTSTVTNSFSTFMAQSVRHKVLLVDGNRRYPHQKARFGIQMDYDLEDFIHGDDGISLDRAIYPVGNSGLSVASLCKVPTERPFVPKIDNLREMLNALRGKFDLVVIDCPAPTHGAESLLFAGEVDGVVMVVEADGTNQRQALRTKEIMESNGGKMLGFIFNKRRYYIPNWVHNLL